MFEWARSNRDMYDDDWLQRLGLASMSFCAWASLICVGILVNYLLKGHPSTSDCGAPEFQQVAPCATGHLNVFMFMLPGIIAGAVALVLWVVVVFATHFFAEKSGRYINATARLLCFFGFVPWFFFIFLLTSPIWFTLVLIQGLLGDAGGGAGSDSGGYYKRTDTMLTWASVYKGLYDRYSPSVPAGAVTTGGSVYRGIYSPSTGDNLLVGTVTQDGSVYQGLYSRNQGGVLVGTVTEDGSIYQGLHSTYGGGGLLVGTVTTDGNIYKGIYSRYGGGNQNVGHVEPKVSIKIMGGAALLLLLS